MTNQALTDACQHIEETFRPERKQRDQLLLNGHRIMQLVQGERYEFTEACLIFDVRVSALEEALGWLIDDNVRLNAKYETSVHHQSPLDYIMVGWMKDEEAAKIIKFKGVA